MSRMWQTLSTKHPSSIPPIPAYVFDFFQKPGYLTIPQPLPEVAVGGNYTITNWINLRGGDFGASQSVIEYVPASTNRNAITILIGGAGPGVVATNLYDGTWQVNRSKRPNLYDGNWHLIAMTITNGTLALYVDGALDTEPPSGAGNLQIDPIGYVGYVNKSLVPTNLLQADLRIYDRPISQTEVKEILAAGRNDVRTTQAAVSDYTHRWHPETDETVTVPDLTGSGNDMVWVGYQSGQSSIQPIVGDNRWMYSIGNSLTADAYADTVTNFGGKLVNGAQDLDYTWNNPNSSTVSTSYLYPDAFADHEWDVLSLQPYCKSNQAKTYAYQMTYIENFINAATGDPPTVVLHDSFPFASEVVQAVGINAPDNGNCAYSNIANETLLGLMQTAYPGKNIFRSRTIQAMYKVAADFAKGNSVGIGGIGAPYTDETWLYRDEEHANWITGRYLVHTCMRRSLGIPPSRNYPFSDNTTYESIPDATADYLDGVVDWVFTQYVDNPVNIITGNGTDTYVDWNNPGSSLVPETEPFTIEFDLLAVETATLDTIFSQWVDGAVGRFAVAISHNSELELYWFKAIPVALQVAFNGPGWHHVTITRDGATITLDVDGVTDSAAAAAESIGQFGNVFMGVSDSGNYNENIGGNTSTSLANFKVTAGATTTIPFNEGSGRVISGQGSVVGGVEADFWANRATYSDMVF